jgi:NOL1/NOP2/fmu family ribosome biogenesis protein
MYGCSDIFSGFVVFKTSKEEKIWITTKESLAINMEKLRVQSMGLYIGRLDKGTIRLSVEGAQLAGRSATKNVVEINKENEWDFLRGFDVNTAKKTDAEDNSYVIVKCGADILGVAKLIGEKLQNVLPKSRKLVSLTKEKVLNETEG